MSKKSEFRRLFRESFAEDAAWTDWFFDAVYSDADALLLEGEGGAAVCGMLMSPYTLAYAGSELPAAYLSCVATAKTERGKGLMHRFMPRALKEAAERGYAIATLIPASRRLYFFYDHFDFATVFYIDEQRYTSLHVFDGGEGFEAIEPTYETYSRLENADVCGIRHSRSQFEHVLHDYGLSGGHVLAVRGPDGAEAMAFVHAGTEARVRAVLADSDQAREAVLALARATAGEVPVVVERFPAVSASALASATLEGIGHPVSLESRGMARILNVQMVLEALAAYDPAIEQVIRVRDHLVKANDSIFTLHKGECCRTPDTLRKVTLDVDVAVLTKLLFSTPAVGNIFNLPTWRPVMALMLE